MNSLKIEDIAFTVRDYNLLKAAGCETVDDILKFKTYDELFVKANKCPRAISNIIEILNELGISWAIT